MASPTLPDLVARGTLDAELGALLWLLVEGGLPLVATGRADPTPRAQVAEAVLAIQGHGWLLLDADHELPTTGMIAGLMASGLGAGLSLGAADLRDLLARLGASGHGWPEDAVRRLGVVIVVEAHAVGTRLAAVHYLRAAERDAQGHVQRRPPAVLATWDGRSDVYEHFAWGITPELADRVDRAQADFEERQAARARFLAAEARAGPAADEWPRRLAHYLASEPPRVPAPPAPVATPSPFHSRLLDADGDGHVH